MLMISWPWIRTTSSCPARSFRNVWNSDSSWLHYSSYINLIGGSALIRPKILWYDISYMVNEFILSCLTGVPRRGVLYIRLRISPSQRLGGPGPNLNSKCILKPRSAKPTPNLSLSQPYILSMIKMETSSVTLQRRGGNRYVLVSACTEPVFV